MEETFNQSPTSEPEKNNVAEEGGNRGFDTRRVLTLGGTVFAMATFVSLAMLFYELFVSQSYLRKSPGSLIELFNYYSQEIITFSVLLTTSILSFLCYKAAGTIKRNVIPEEDRSLLDELIRKDDLGIDQYIRLSSLSGTTGFFTKLGLTGLPLATIGLTIIFTVLFLISQNNSLFDLAKLTLGAFLGSYVQKSPSPAAKKKKEKKYKTSVSSSENPYTDSGPLL